MTIRIAHASDTHDKPSIVRQACQSDCDLILLTGDVLSNMGRVPRTFHTINPHREIKYQEGWGRKQAKKWAADAGNTPILVVRGNHDFISPAKWLHHYGANVHEITDREPCVELLGYRFAGFRQINRMIGEWCGEEDDLRPFVEKAFKCDPDILVTHVPPNGILDGYDGYGCKELTSALFYQDHRITHHFFGHCHEDGGGLVEKGGVVFVNSAETWRVVEIPSKNRYDDLTNDKDVST